jgi:hypothetical protein
MKKSNGFLNKNGPTGPVILSKPLLYAKRRLLGGACRKKELLPLETEKADQPLKAVGTAR